MRSAYRARAAPLQRWNRSMTGRSKATARSALDQMPLPNPFKHAIAQHDFLLDPADLDVLPIRNADAKWPPRAESQGRVVRRCAAARRSRAPTIDGIGAHGPDERLHQQAVETELGGIAEAVE